MLAFLNNLLELSLEAAPWLLLGMIIGGLLKAWIPVRFMEKHLGGKGFTPVIKAAILGAPLPLCSCGVIPAALALRKAGASKRATVSFLVSTPETGVDSVSITYALLGPFMAIVRPIASVASALAAGMLAGRNEATIKQPIASGLGAIPIQVTSCCSSSEAGESSCCSGDAKEKPASTGFMSRTLDGLSYAFGQLLGDMLLWLTVGLIFAALIKTFAPATFLAQWGSGLPAMLLMIVIGIPMYVCATASTPIAAGLMLAGVSPGVALVFLMAGPATNIATLGIISKELGRRAIAGYLTGVIGVALLAGYLTDYLVAYWNINIQAQLSAGLEIAPLWIAWSSLIIILLTAFKPLLHR